MSKMLWSGILLQWNDNNNVHCTMVVETCPKLLTDWPDSLWWWACVYPLNTCADCMCLQPMARHHRCLNLCCPRPCVFPRPHRSSTAASLPVCGSHCPHCCWHGRRKASRILEDAEENNDHMVPGLIDALSWKHGECSLPWCELFWRSHLMKLLDVFWE